MTKRLDKPLNILVKRRGAIGDVIMTTGVVRELKRKYNGDANIYVATDSLEVYKNNPHITSVVPFDAVKSAAPRRTPLRNTLMYPTV